MNDILLIFQVTLVVALALQAVFHVFSLAKTISFYPRFLVSFIFFAVFSFYLFLYSVSNKAMPWQNFSEILVTLSWLLTGILLVIEFRTQEKTLAIIPAFLAAFLGILGISFLHAFQSSSFLQKMENNSNGSIIFTLSENTYPLGVLLLFLSYVFLFYALSMSFLYRMVFREIKWQRSSFFIRHFPALSVLETYMIFFTTISLFLLAIVFCIRYLYPYFSGHWDFLPTPTTENFFFQQNLLPSVFAWVIASVTIILRFFDRLDSKSVFFGLIFSMTFVAVNFFL